MEDSKRGIPSMGMPAEEAEEFMALLLKAQSTSHKCPFCDYFKKEA